MGRRAGETGEGIVRTPGGRAGAAEPDAGLFRGGGVAYRYVLGLREPAETGTILRILEEVSIPLRYLLLLTGGSRSGYTAYLGLASSDVLDLPIRFASHGILVERGEETGDDGR